MQHESELWIDSGSWGRIKEFEPRHPDKSMLIFNESTKKYSKENNKSIR